MGKIDYKKQKIPFTQIANGLIYDKNLSAKAKGVYCYLYAKPEGWDFSARRIQQDFVDGRKSINNALQELEEAGYLERQRQNDGRVTYYIKYPPTQSPETGQWLPDPKSPKGKVPKRQSAEREPVINKDIKEIKIRKEIKTSGVPPQDISELIKLFEELELSAQAGRWYKNKTQRSALEELLKKFGRESVEKVIRLLPKTNKQQYMPKVTTPHQLEQKWYQLRDALIAKKNEITNNKPKMI